MTETAPEAPTPVPQDVWHLDFFLCFDPNALQPCYVNVDIARKYKVGEESTWERAGTASFDGPAVIPPRADQDFIPYMLYHLDELKSWLMEEHVRNVWNDGENKIPETIALPIIKAPLRAVE